MGAAYTAAPIFPGSPPGAGPPAPGGPGFRDATQLGAVSSTPVSLVGASNCSLSSRITETAVRISCGRREGRSSDGLPRAWAVGSLVFLQVTADDGLRHLLDELPPRHPARGRCGVAGGQRAFHHVHDVADLERHPVSTERRVTFSTAASVRAIRSRARDTARRPDGAGRGPDGSGQAGHHARRRQRAGPAAVPKPRSPVRPGHRCPTEPRALQG